MPHFSHPQFQAQSITLAGTIAAALQPHAHHAFGLMGNGNAHFINALTHLGVLFTPVRHEVAGIASADAYTRVTGRIAIATATYGAGFTNMLTALAEAAQARTPMLVVVGDAPSTGLRAWDIDQEMAAAAVGVRTYTVNTHTAHTVIDRAAERALRSKTPVILAIPYDLATAVMAAVDPTPTQVPETHQEIDLDDPEVIHSLAQATRPPQELPIEKPALPFLPTNPAANIRGFLERETVFAEAVTALAQAQRPLILAGRGAWIAGASEQLSDLADDLGALTASTALARGIFRRPEYDLGITGGFGQEHAMACFAEADVVVVVGASLNQFTMRFGALFGEATTVIRIDIDHVAAPLTKQAITHLLLSGDARTQLNALRVAVSTRPKHSLGWREQITGLEPNGHLRLRADGQAEHPNGVCADGRLDPRTVAARIGKLLPKDRHVTSDGGHFMGWPNMYWSVASPERNIMVGTAYQSIGLGFSTVAGVAAAAPESTVVLNTGDGGGLMALADLETTIRTANSCIVVVWNDAAYGAEVHLYGVMGLEQPPMIIPEINFAGIAAAFGATGVSVRSLDDLSALRTWTQNGAVGTIVLDCHISRSVVSPHQYEVMQANGIHLPKEN